MRFFVIILFLALVVSGCSTQKKMEGQQQTSFLAGENAELRREQGEQFQTVTVMGDVQNSTVPYVEGLTLAQAIATANYLDPKAPKKILITRNGETAELDTKVLFSGATIPLEPGDVIELRQ